MEDTEKKWKKWIVHHWIDEDQWNLYLLTIICAKTSTMIFEDLLLEIA